MKAKKWLLWLGFALSAVLLGVILRRLDWPVFVAELKQLRYEWLAAAVVFIVCGMALRTYRWKVAAGVPHARYRAFWTAATIGLLLNQIYPLRAGEVFRVFALRHLARIPLGASATSALVDRLADFLMLGVSAFLVAATHSGMTHAEHLAVGALTAVLAVFAGLIAFTRGDRLWRRWIAALSTRVSPNLRKRIEGFYSEAIATAVLLGSPSRVAAILLLTAGCFCLDFAVAYCALQAFGWELPFVAAITVLVFLAIGTSLPSAPGYAGVYQIACIFALKLFGIGESQAVAYSIVLQICVLVTIIALSGWVAAGHMEELKSARGAMGRLE